MCLCDSVCQQRWGSLKPIGLCVPPLHSYSQTSQWQKDPCLNHTDSSELSDVVKETLAGVYQHVGLCLVHKWIDVTCLYVRRRGGFEETCHSSRPRCPRSSLSKYAVVWCRSRAVDRKLRDCLQLSTWFWWTLTRCL